MGPDVFLVLKVVSKLLVYASSFSRLLPFGEVPTRLIFPAYPLVGVSVVQTDKKGRLLLPSEIRKKVKARRFKVAIKKNTIELQPLPDLRVLKGKYRSLIKNEWEELEERAQKLVSEGKR